MAFSFKNFLSGLGFGGNTIDSAVGIDIGSSAIKIVEIKKEKGKAVLLTYGSVSLSSYGETDAGRVTNLPVEKISEALKEVIKQSAATAASVELAIPVQSSLIFTLELPIQIKEEEMRTIIETESRKYVPVPISEVSLDYFILPKKEEAFQDTGAPGAPLIKAEKLEVLVVAIQNDAVSKYRSIVSQCNLLSSFFEIEIFSSIRSNFEHELSLVLLMDFGASRTKLSLVEFGMVKSYHTINRGGADISDAISKSLDIPFAQAEELKKSYGLFENPTEKNLPDIVKAHLDYIFSEANNVLINHEKKYNQTISKVILTGGGALTKGLQEMATSNFRAEVEIGQPFSKVSAPEFLEKVLTSIGPEFSVAIGLALRKLQ